MKLKLVKPTVTDVGGVLQSLPPHAMFRIRDPDTGWTIESFEIELRENGEVWITASYADMVVT